MKKVLIGLGGAGSNTINNIIEDNKFQIDTLVINADKEGLKGSLSNNKIFLDIEKFENKEKAFQKISSSISNIIQNYNIMFIVLGLGVDCGSCTIKLIHQVIKDKNIETRVIGIMPFNFEGTARKKKASETIHNIKGLYDELKLFENQSLFNSANTNTTFLEAFKFMDNNITSFIKEKS